MEVLVGTPTGDPVSAGLCRAVVELSGSSGGSVSIRAGGGDVVDRTVLWTSSEQARRLEDVQDSAGHGPGFEVLSTGQRLSVQDLAAQQLRWPRLVDALRVADVPSVALDAFAMRSAGRMVGVLALYRPNRVPSTVDATDVQFFADVVGSAVLEDLTDAEPSAVRWSERDVVAQATGMVVAQLDVSVRRAGGPARTRPHRPDHDDGGQP